MRIIKNEIDRLKYLYKELTTGQYNFNPVLSIIMLIITYPLSIIVRVVMSFINLFRKGEWLNG